MRTQNPHVGRLVTATRTAQGLPPTIADPTILRRVAAALVRDTGDPKVPDAIATTAAAAKRGGRHDERT